MGVSGWVNFWSLIYGTMIQFSPTNEIPKLNPLGCFNPLGIIVQKIYHFHPYRNTIIFLA
jgi:hypothetical protein